MVNIIVALLLITGVYDSGWSSRYDPYVMDWQLEYHQLTAPCDGCAVAVADCSKIGSHMLIRPVGTLEWTPVVVTDCAGNDGTPEWMTENNIIVELSYELAVQFGAVDGGIEVEVMR